MKKSLLLVIISFSLLFVYQPGARALEISAGPAVWYAWWSPYFKDYFETRLHRKSLLWHVYNNTLPIESRWNESGSFLYGPLLSVKFSERWSLSAVFMAGAPYDQTGGCTRIIGGSSYIYKNIGINMKKYDSDSTIVYSINPYLRAFGGFKYQGYAYRSRRKDTFAMTINAGVIDPVTYRYRSDSDGYGAGLGLGTTLPLWRELYLLGNVSGVFLRSVNQWRETFVSSSNGAVNDQYQRFDAWGLNTTLSLAWYVPAASVTVSGGFRFQALKMYCRRLVNSLYDSNTSLNQVLVFNKGSDASAKDIFNGSIDYFYGAVLSVTYSFSL